MFSSIFTNDSPLLSGILQNVISLFTSSNRQIHILIQFLTLWWHSPEKRISHLRRLAHTVCCRLCRTLLMVHSQQYRTFHCRFSVQSYGPVGWINRYTYESSKCYKLTGGRTKSFTHNRVSWPEVMNLNKTVWYIGIGWSAQELLTNSLSRAGHLRYFFIFSIIENDFFAFYEDDTLFLHQSYLKSPLPVKLTW